MLEIMKKVARQTARADAPACWMFGTVTALAPLTVCVDGRFYLSGAPLVVLRELLGHSHGVAAHQVDAAGEHGHTVPDHETQAAQGHSHAVSALAAQAAGSHSHGVPARETETAQALAVGDKVALLRDHGGQRYLLLGRV